jgi:hypothetical protein
MRPARAWRDACLMFSGFDAGASAGASGTSLSAGSVRRYAGACRQAGRLEILQARFRDSAHVREAVCRQRVDEVAAGHGSLFRVLRRGGDDLLAGRGVEGGV